MSHVAVFLGDFRDVKTRRTRHYFEERWTFMDCRGRVEIADSAHFGYGVKILSASHRYDPFRGPPTGVLGRMIRSIVVVEDEAWIGSHVLLYRCRIGHHSVVGAGTTIKSMQVPPWSIVDGSPPMIVGMFDYHRDGRHYRVDPIPLKGF
jgi:acetyltransferase-like isoleucine patch superfamily enzyme